jgi:hypothetical protein
MLNVCYSPSAGHIQTLVDLARARAEKRETDDQGKAG